MSWWRRGLVALTLAAVGGLAGMSWADPRLSIAIAALSVVLGWCVPEVMRRFSDRGQARRATRDITEPSPEPEPAMLLHPTQRVVPFLGRTEVLDDLLAWCRNKDGEPVRLLVGPGGVGKSRLAIELGAKLGRGWETITVRNDREDSVVPSCERSRSRRVLLVLDYAETRSRAALTHLLEDVSATNKHLRVLLIARKAGEWWTDMAKGSARARQILAATSVTDLTEHEPPGSDEQLVREAMAHFAPWLGLRAPTNVNFESARKRDNRFLDLHTAALTAVLDSVQHGSSAPVTVTTDGVLDQLLGHERRYWAQSASANPRLSGLEKPERVIAGCILLGARTEDEAQDIVARLPIGTAAPGAVATWFRCLYPPQDPEYAWWGSLRPDRLAEVHVVRQLINSESLRRACLHNLDDLQVRHVYTLLARAAWEQPEAVTLLEEYLGPILDTDIPSWRTLYAILAVLPTESVRLAELGVRLTQALLAATPMDASGTRARILGMLGGWLGKTEDYTKAEETTRQAISLYRVLPGDERDRNQDGLAMSYGNLSAHLTHQGLHIDAQQAAHEAVSINRRLVSETPQHYRRVLAGSLTNLAGALGQAGCHSEVIPHAEEAREIYRELAETSPEQYLPELASASMNLGYFLGEAGRHDQALKYANQAVDIYQQLADAYPDRYRPNLATALHNKGNHLGELGLYEDAIPLTEDALRIRRELADTYPGRYREDLAFSLNNLGYHKGMLELHGDALPHTEEAVELRRILAATHPERHMSDLARSLTNLINHLHELSRPKDSLRHTKEALAIRWGLFHMYGERFRADLVSSLENFARNLAALGSESGAQALYREAHQFQPSPFNWDDVICKSFDDPAVAEWLRSRQWSHEQEVAGRKNHLG